MCDHYADLKRDFIYRGDILREVPFVSLDGKTIRVPSSSTDFTQPWIPLWKRKKSGLGAFTPCIADLQLRTAVVLTRTCEAAKFSGVKRVYPAIFLAPIRELSDFASDGETGEEFAEKIAKGFPTEKAGDAPTDCYRFSVVSGCVDHGMQPGLICFREMQPVHLKYLVEATRIARLSERSVQALMTRFLQFMVQRESDDAADREPEGETASTVLHYLQERARERDQAKEQMKRDGS